MIDGMEPVPTQQQTGTTHTEPMTGNLLLDWSKINRRQAKFDIDILGQTLDEMKLTFMGHATSDIAKFMAIMTDSKLRLSTRGTQFANLSYAATQDGHGPLEKYAGTFIYDRDKKDYPKYTITPDKDPLNPNYNMMDISLDQVDYVLLPDELASTARKAFPDYGEKIKSYNELAQELKKRSTQPEQSSKKQ